MDKGIQDNIQETAIVILHYINEELTNKCIDSILENTEAGTFRIYLVDNNSPKPYEFHPSGAVTIIRNNDRHSVSGMNFGFYYALYKATYNHKYIVNLDNDIIVHKGWLEPLVREMEEHPSTGICGGKQWNKEGDTYLSVGSDLSGFIYRNFPINRQSVVWIQGSFHMYRAEMMRYIGLHDTRFKDICSDSDYCLQASDRGWDVVFVPDSNVTHLGNTSYKAHPVDFSDDFPLLLSKWFGLKFNSLANTLPINAKNNIYGSIKYSISRRA